MSELQLVPPVFGPAGPLVNKAVDLDDVFAGYFAFGDQDGCQLGGKEMAQDSSEGGVEGPALDVEGFGSLGTDVNAGIGLEPRPPSHTFTGGRRGIGIGIGVAAGAAGANRGVKRELSETRLGGSFPFGVGEAAGRSMSEQQKLERRERNREHAKRSRIRKKFMLECLQEQLLAMRKQNMALRQIVKENMPNEAAAVFEKCINEKALVLSGKGTASAQPIPSDDEEESRESNCLLLEPDFQLMQALMESQQNFTISDPSMPDNPIVYASQGFLNLTGYTMQNVIGRNCRFLQGQGTDPRAIDIIRRGVAEGRDTSVCLMNYKADGTPFWNQFFVAALRDENEKIVNFVGVQCEVKEETQDAFRERLRKIPLPEELMRDENEDEDM
uniref:Putative LOV domain-containing protein n=1 Tax=Dictyopteris undulata TaxID=156997 RepID=A0A126WZ27_9PHAE|nr:putative LOV domain-containing protein [Dictyopteris undulata]